MPREGAAGGVAREEGGKRELNGGSLCAHVCPSALLLPAPRAPDSPSHPLCLPSPASPRSPAPAVEGRAQSGRVVDRLLQLSWWRHTWV